MATMKKPGKSDAKKPTFEEGLARLEEIVHELEEGRIGLDEALARYEEGVKFLKRCHALLEKAERKIELLAGVDEGGAAVTEPLDEGETTLDEKAKNRTKRRSRAKKRDPDPSSGHTLSSTDVDEPDRLF